MASMRLLFLIGLLICCACEKVSPDAVEFDLDYSWGIRPGENRTNPEIKLTGIPVNTTYLKIQLVDLDVTFANHGEIEKIAYDGSGVIPRGALKKYIGPSPPRREGYQGNLYEFTVKALNQDGVIIGIGKKAKRCCP